MKVVFASNNKGKILELENLLSSFQIDIIPQSVLSVDEIEETALTFVENAILKARHACEKTGLSAIADDSGLVIEKLNGAPGIFSARFAGIPSDPKANIQKVLKALEGEENRNAYFHCTLVYMRHAKDPSPIICEGNWYGTILTSPTGTSGFGYDPIFYVENEKCSAAQMSVEKKNRISHRGLALQNLVQQLQK